MRPFLSNAISEAICSARAFMVSGSFDSVSKVITMSKASSSTFSMVIGSGTPVTLKNTSSGPNR